MKNRRIIFVLQPFDFPAGGVAVIYRHAELLAQHGFRAFVSLPNRPKIDFYGSTAPLIIHNGRIDIEKGDIYVIPEGFSDYMEALRRAPVRRIMFCQNHYYLPFSENPKIGFAEFPVHKVIISSDAIRSFMEDVYGLTKLALIPYAIDTDIFNSRSEKIRRVAYMPRKLPAESEFIKATFKRVYKEYSDVPWIAIDNLAKMESSEILRTSEIFLSLSHRDSFGLPPLEAMACGCLVSGYHGDGGREYMSESNGWWAADGDWRSCVHGIGAALKLNETGGRELENMRREMYLTVNRYSPEAMEKGLLHFWEEEVKAPFG